MPPLLLKYFSRYLLANQDWVYTPVGTRVRRSFDVSLTSIFLDGDSWLEAHLKPNEELFEWIDLCEAIEAAGDTFTMAELGAGYGRWLVSGAEVARRNGKIPRLIGVEAEATHFACMRQHFIDNCINPDDHILLEAAASDNDAKVYFVEGHGDEWWGQAVLPSQDYGYGDWPQATVTQKDGLSLNTILRDVEIVDLIDMDIQGAEVAVVRGGRNALCDKVKRIHIGTHGNELEDELVTLFRDMHWQCINNFRCNSTERTQFGNINFQDGVQSWLNPTLN